MLIDRAMHIDRTMLIDDRAMLIDRYICISIFRAMLDTNVKLWGTIFIK